MRKLLNKRKAFVRENTFCSKNAIHFLNISQFFGAANDNVFKFLAVFFLISLKGVDASSSILFWTGTVFVLPFLLFSSAGGVIADRISKQKILVWFKFFEVLIAIAGVLALTYKSEIGCYVVIFLFALQSSIFSPAKYSVIPEIVPKNKISKANGLITSFTYLAIIFGTYIATFATRFTEKNYVLAGYSCLIIAVLGFVGSLFIPYTQPARSTKKVNPYFLKEIIDALKYCKTKKNLRTCIFGSAMFLYVGSFLQLNLIPLAIQSLGMSEEGGGSLFLAVAIGIAIGAFFAGKISKKQPELGMTCLASFLFFIMFFCLAMFATQKITVFALLVLIGVVGGFFIVPFDSYLQTHCGEKMRGQVVAASNFISFGGVLLAPLSIYLFSGIFGFNAAQGFMIVASLVMVATMFFTAHLSGQLFHFLARKILKRIYNIDLQSSPFPTEEGCTLIIKNGSWLKALLISICSPNIHFYFVKPKKTFSDAFYRLYRCISPFYLDRLGTPSLNGVIDYFSYSKQHEISCLLLSKKNPTVFPRSIVTNGLYNVDFSFKKKRSVSIVFE